jgi:hypothetical protein
MDQNTTSAIFNLMQNVVDKLDTISQDLKNKDDKELKDIFIRNSNEIKVYLKKTINNQAELANQNLVTEGKIIEYMEKKISTHSIKNYTEYNLFGNKSHFKPSSLVLLAFSLVLVWSSIKYLPTYFSNNSVLTREKEDYELFYNYIYLNKFKSTETLTADKILKRIQDKDTLFLKEYNTLLKTYQKEVKKQQLKEELKSLGNNDR